MKNEIILFEDQGVTLEVNMKDETVWLNAHQMAELFDRDVKTIRKHIKKALEQELKDEEVVAKFASTTKHGAILNKTQTRLINYYNLDVVLSVGYRVESNKGIRFRKWANKVLKEYLIKGYAVNEERLKSLEKAVQLIDIAHRVTNSSKEISDILDVIHHYSFSLGLLDDYDHHSFKKKKGHHSHETITYEQCMYIIDSLKNNFDSNIFALERNHGLQSIISNIYQTYGGEDVYKSIEEKCANFFYMIIKNHVFIDGNKRIAATLFIYILFFYDLLYQEDKTIIDNNTLVALTILIAESNPKEKSIMIDLIMNLL